MLEGENIVLRPLRMSDWEKTLIWRNNISIKKNAMMHPFPITEMIEKEWYENLLKSSSNKSIYFAITDKSDIPIGFVRLNEINYTNRNCYLGIIIGDPDTRGKGFGKEAMVLMLSYAFNTLNLNKVTVEVNGNNKIAIALYKNLNFKIEGCLKQQYFVDGNYLDVYIMSVFKMNT